MLQAEHMNIPSPFGGSFRTRVAGQCLDIVPGLELPRRGKPSWRSAPDALAEIAQLCGYLPLAPAHRRSAAGVPAGLEDLVVGRSASG